MSETSGTSETSRTILARLTPEIENCQNSSIKLYKFDFIILWAKKLSKK